MNECDIGVYIRDMIPYPATVQYSQDNGDLDTGIRRLIVSWPVDGTHKCVFKTTWHKWHTGGLQDVLDRTIETILCIGESKKILLDELRIPDECVVSLHIRDSRPLSPSEALYGFAGWLTSREKQTVMSSRQDAGHVADLVKTFCDANGLPEPRDGWEEILVHPRENTR